MMSHKAYQSLQHLLEHLHNSIVWKIAMKWKADCQQLASDLHNSSEQPNQLYLTMYDAHPCIHMQLTNSIITNPHK